MTTGLTPDDRELIRAALGKVNKRIVLNILQKIESGGIPTPREMEILNSSTDAPPAAPAADSVAPAPELRLESPDTPTGQAGVAALYEVSVRKVKRWVAAGREADDPPPLHSPAEMRVWHERLRERGIFKHKCGSEFDAAASKVTAAPAAPRVQSSQEESLPEIADLNIELNDFDPSMMDFDDGVAAAKMNFKVQATLLRKAFEGKNEDDRRRARAAFKEALDLYREVERDREKIMAASGRLMKRDVIRREMVSLHSNIASRLKSRLKESLTEMPTAIQSRETWAGFCDRLVDEICRQLVETKFASEDSQAQAA